MSADRDDAGMQKHAPPEGRASARPVSAGLYRRHPIHLPPLGNRDRAVIIFVTVCTAGRRRVLDGARLHEVIVESWQAGQAWLIGRYVIMPDHIHFFCAPNEFDGPSLERWVRYRKSIASRNLGETGGNFWQRHF